MSNRAFLLEIPNDDLRRVYLFETIDDALAKAGSFIASWVLEPPPHHHCCPVVRERLNQLLRKKEYRWAVHEWNRRRPEVEIIIYCVRIESKVMP